MRPGRHQPHHYYRKKRGIIEHTSRFPITHRVSERPSPLSVGHLLCLFSEHNTFRIRLDSSMSSTFRYKVDRRDSCNLSPEFDALRSLPYTPISSCTLLSHRLAFLEPLASRPPAHTQTLLSVPEYLRKGFLHGRSYLPPRTRPRDSRRRSCQSNGARRQGVCPRRPRPRLSPWQSSRLLDPPPLCRRHQGRSRAIPGSRARRKSRLRAKTDPRLAAASRQT